MKKIGILFFAALLVVAFTLPAAALENQFGGYWRTRFYTMQNFTGEDKSEAMDYSLVDTRTRLYYTAILNDNLKFVNKFEMDATWGDSGYGDIGTDGKALFEIKHTYADFNIGSINAKIGAQGVTLARGFLFDDDFMGANVAFKGEGFSVPFVWIKAYEGGAGKDANDYDFDYYVLNPSFNLGDNLTINPFYMLATSDDASAWGAFDKFGGLYEEYFQDMADGLTGPVVSMINSGIADAIYYGNADEYLETALENLLGIPSGYLDIPNIPYGAGLELGLDLNVSVAAMDTNVNYLGLNVDWSFDGGGLWFTGIYEFGSLDMVASVSGTLTETFSYETGPVTITDTYDQDIAIIDAVLTDSVDVKAYLVALGGNINLGGADVHGQAFYATGQDLTDEDEDDITAFTGPKGQCYYWAEIMGYGIFDYDVSAGGPADQISNVMAFNLGASFKPMDKLSLSADIWYASLVEDNAAGNDKLGTEVDLVATYQLIENLKLDVVGAYLFAGDATYDGENDADPYELGARLSLSF